MFPKAVRLNELGVLSRCAQLLSPAIRRRPVPPPFRKLNDSIWCRLKLQSNGSRQLTTHCLRQDGSLALSSTQVQLSTSTHRNPIVAETPKLPVTCPGCGALSQVIGSDEPGFYSKSRKPVKRYLRDKQEAERIVGKESHSVVNTNDHNALAEDDISLNQTELPVCDRCHDLIYNNQGQSIVHPSVESLVDTIAESPFGRNHVYHVLDAADFPMSLIPKVFKALELAKPRSQNRRARTKFTAKPTISFIITRSDLLGPSKTMVDSMMPYFQDVLRNALGRQGKDMRLGNIHLVSAKRGWWTKEIKDDIWERGGGNWMVGKVNVGKSNLFPVLFPKGSGDRAPIYAELSKQCDSTYKDPKEPGRNETLREMSLLPPPQPEVPFPTMPVVSHLPGTTASPIRLPFGNKKGELIDLPGLDRGDLDRYLHPDHKHDLVMQYRPNVKQHVIKPGQSLLLGGGLVRITPQLDAHDRNVTMLAYPFLPIDVHVTSTDKAIALGSGPRQSGIKSIVADGAKPEIKLTGKFYLETDVTKSRAGPLVKAGVPVTKLPFKVYSSDILIEGVGWVELVCQVRKTRGLEADPGTSIQTPSDVEALAMQPGLATQETSTGSEVEFRPFARGESLGEIPQNVPKNGFTVPHVDIFSPEGRHIGQRKPLGAWLLWHEAEERRRRTLSATRPRKSMKGAKRRDKIERRSQLTE